jgi:sodium/proline symporter
MTVVPPAREEDRPMLWIFLAYLLITMALGFWQGSRTKSQADFVLGSSRLPGWMLALSERATGESAWLLLGFTGFIYAKGLWIGVGCLTGIFTAWIILARKFRSEAERYRAMTMPEYFSAKFPDKANTIRTLSTLIIAFFFIFYVGAQFAGAGKTIQVTFGLSPFWGQLLSAAVIMTYASFGGFISVVAVDAFQAILMILTLIVTPVVMFGKVMAGPVSIGQALAAAGPGMSSLTGGAVMIGLCALALFGPKAVKNAEMVLPFALTSLFPTWLAGILLAGAVAAMVSTAESMLIVAGTAISQDAYKSILRKGNVPDRTLLRVSRGATLAIGVLSLVLALTTEKLIYSIVSYAWAGIGCSFAPAVLLSFYWDRFSSAGVVTALLAGLVTTVAWIATGLDQHVTAMAATFFIAMGSAILVTLATSLKDGVRPQFL